MLSGIFQRPLVEGCSLGSLNNELVFKVNKTAVDSSRSFKLTLNTDVAGSNRLSGSVGSSAHVGSRVLRISVQDIQSNETKVVRGTVTMTLQSRKKYIIQNILGEALI